jgi:hypothetical protein
MEVRLKKRYEKLVKAHMNTGSVLSAGVKSFLTKDSAFNQTQAAWRFFNNEKCSLEELSKPLLKAAHELSAQECDNYQLVPHDWSCVTYGKHKSKKDISSVNRHAIGYDFQSSLMMSDRHGGPLALVAMNLKTDQKILSTYHKHLEGLNHLEELSQRIAWLESQKFEKPLVHIIDREADSVAFLRALENKKWIIRANGRNYAYHGDSKKKISVISEGLLFSQARDIEYKGKTVLQEIAETTIVIKRDARPKRKVGDKRPARLKGIPLTVQLIVSRIVDKEGKELTRWYLLAQGLTVSPATIALWYYWRWSIESFFKLLKSAGMNLESWQQETGEAIARRLLVASMACVFVWKIAEAKGPEAGELRDILIRLSGRQMKYGIRFTRPALLAGLCSLLSTLDLLDHYDVEELKKMLHTVLTNQFV